MKNSNWVLWIKIVFMFVALAGIFSAMSYFRSGNAFKDPDSAAGVLLGNSADTKPRSAKVLNENSPPETKPVIKPPVQDPAGH